MDDVHTRIEQVTIFYFWTGFVMIEKLPGNLEKKKIER